MSDRLHISGVRAEHISALYLIYCSQAASLPHAIIPSIERFHAALLGDRRDSILVAEQAGQACGFAALAHVKDHQDTEAQAITALFSADAAANAALITACTARATARPLLAFPQTHGQCPVPGYNAGWDGLSAQLPMIAESLIAHGFQPYYQEWLMSCDLTAWAHKQERLAHPEVSAVGQISIRAEINELGERMQRAWVADQEVGVCVYAARAPLTDSPGTAQIGYIEWLWVDPQYRRQGLARTLLQRAMQHLWLLKCSTCWLTTGAENLAAQPLYHAYGFRMVDIATSYQLR